MSARFEVFEGYHDRTGTALWYWRLIAGNGETVCRSSEGYRDKTDAKRGCTDAAHAMAEVNEIRVIDEHEESG